MSMGAVPESEAILDLLVQWEEQRQQGRTPTPEELCPGDARLQGLLQERLARRQRLHHALDLPGAVSEKETGQPAPFPVIDGYEIGELLGRGGMGLVFKARQKSLKRDVALKIIVSGAYAGAKERARFRTEAEAAARLQDPGIVQIYEVGEQAGCPYLSLEFLGGGSLAQHLDGTPMAPRRAAQLLLALARAVQHAHDQGIIHRDLKPANVLLTQTGVAKIGDFGLAKLVDGSQGHTLTGDMVGTPSYMAPEQAAGRADLVGPATDIYGLGSILYELLAGRPPFKAETPMETLVQVQFAEPVSPSRLQPKLPRDLVTICLSCLQKDPRQRYASARALAEDLDRFLDGRPIQARRTGVLERLGRWCCRKPAVAALLAALVLVFLAGGAGVLWQWRRAARNANDYRQERDATAQEKERAERHLELVRKRVFQLERLGHDLFQKPGQYRAGQAVLEEALAFYQELLPRDGNDPRVRQEAAQLFGQVAWIHNTLGQAEKSAEAWDRQAGLLADLLKEDPTSKDLRRVLSDVYRWRGNALRELGKGGDARQAYEQATAILEELLHESPGNAGYQMSLANTLLNTAGLLSPQQHAQELESLYGRIVELGRASARAVPDNPKFQEELAIVLGAQGMFALGTGRISQAETAVREALQIQQKLLASGRLKGGERYVARNFANLAHILVAAGRVQEAESSYRQAVKLLNPLVKAPPDAAYARADLINTLQDLASLLKDPGRRQEVVEIRSSLIEQYEGFRTDFPEKPEYRQRLLRSYLELASLLGELGRHREAIEPFRKALELAPEDAYVNNELAWFLATEAGPRLRDAPFALRLAKKAVAAEPKSGNYRNTLGVAYFRNGEDRAAIAELEKSMSLQAGGDSFDWFFLAMAHWRLGEREQARTWFDRAVQWMDKHRPLDDQLSRFRREAKALLEVPVDR
jgi:serine/threonine-protein kinase